MKYTFVAESENAAEEMNQILKDVPFNFSDVRMIEVRIELDDEAVVEGQTQIEDFEDVEYGPVADFDREQRPFQTRPGPNDWYEGPIIEGGVMPGTQRAAILNVLDGRWLTTNDVADELNTENLNAISAHLSALFLDNGYVKRRGEQPYQYTLDRDGKEALRLGKMRYEEELVSEEELDSV